MLQFFQVNFEKKTFIDHLINSISNFTNMIFCSGPQNKELDRETHDAYELIFSVSDEQQQVQGRVHFEILDLNDNVPAFVNRTYWFDVFENSPKGTIVSQFLS